MQEQDLEEKLQLKVVDEQPEGTAPASADLPDASEAPVDTAEVGADSPAANENPADSAEAPADSPAEGEDLISSAEAPTNLPAEETPAEEQTKYPDLGERYEIISLIGCGGMSEVYKVHEKYSGNFMVAKVLKGNLISDSSARKRFVQEAELVQQLNHPNIITIKDYSLTKDGLPFLIMEWNDGITLSDHIKETGPVTSANAVPIFHQITQALAYAHSKGVIHRDIKPSNILLVKTNTGFQIKIMDFGIAKLIENDSYDGVHTQTGSVLGSPAYMSPEQCLGENIDARSDIYSLGCVMYETLTGKNPFVGSNPVATILNHLEAEPEPLAAEEFAKFKIPEHLDVCVTKCLDKKPELRYQSASDAQQALFLPPGIFTRLFACWFDAAMLTIICGLRVCLPQAWFDPIKLYCGADLQALCLLYLLYYGLFESLLRATPGKLLTGLRVANLHGGYPSMLGIIGRALVACAAMVWICELPNTGEWAQAIDHSTGSHFALIPIIGYWSQFALFFYLLYTWLFVICKREQLQLDSFFGRRIITLRAAKFQKVSKRAGKLGLKHLAVAAASVGIIIGLPLLHQCLMDYSWGNPLVVKDRVVCMAQTLDGGAHLQAENLELVPTLRTDNSQSEYYIYDPKIAVGQKLIYIVPQATELGTYALIGGDKLPHGAPFWVNNAREAEARHDTAEAQTDYLQALKIDPYEKEALLGLARFYEARGQLARAQANRQKAESIKPPNAVQLAKGLNSGRKFQEALAVTKAAVAADPTDCEALRQMALAMEGLDAQTTALTIWRQLITIQPTDSNALGHLAHRLDRSGQYAEAKQLAQRAVRADDRSADAWATLASALHGLGDRKGSEAAYRKALKLDPSRESTRNSLVELLRAQNRSAEANKIRNAAKKGRDRTTLSLWSSRNFHIVGSIVFVRAYQGRAALVCVQVTNRCIDKMRI